MVLKTVNVPGARCVMAALLLFPELTLAVSAG